MSKNKELFETTPVPKALAMMAVPTIISQLITMVYNLADTYYIAHTENPYMVAAASISFTLYFVMNALSNLFGVGGSSLISRLLGEKRPEEARKVCSFSFYGTIFVTLIYSSCCLIFMEPLLRLMGATDNTVGYASQYALFVIVIGGIPSTLSMAMAHLLISEGYAKYASFGLGGGGVLNIILDPIFMFVVLDRGNEVMGAAIATLISNCLSLVYFGIVFIRLRKTTVLCVSPKLMFPERKSVISVFAVGLPSAIGSLVSCVSNTVINKLTSGYNDFAVAAMGIVKKIDMLPLNVGMGLCQAMVPMVAYNYSAKNYKRMSSFIAAARTAGMAFAFVCIIAFECFSPSIVRLFMKESARTINYATDFLRIAVLATPFMISNVQMSYTLQAMGKGAGSLLLTACRQGLINIPLLFIMNAIAGLYGVIWTQLISDVLTVVVSVCIYRGVMKRIEAKEKL